MAIASLETFEQSRKEPCLTGPLTMTIHYATRMNDEAHGHAQARPARGGPLGLSATQAKDSDVRMAAREARAAQQTATGAAVANRRHDRASARIRTVEHRAHRQLTLGATANTTRPCQLSQEIRHSNVTATPIATHAPGTAGDSTQRVQVIASPPNGTRYLVPRAVKASCGVCRMQGMLSNVKELAGAASALLFFLRSDHSNSVAFRRQN